MASRHHGALAPKLPTALSAGAPAGLSNDHCPATSRAAGPKNLPENVPLPITTNPLSAVAEPVKPLPDITPPPSTRLEGVTAPAGKAPGAGEIVMPEMSPLTDRGLRPTFSKLAVRETSPARKTRVPAVMPNPVGGPGGRSGKVNRGGSRHTTNREFERGLCGRIDRPGACHPGLCSNAAAGQTIDQGHRVAGQRNRRPDRTCQGRFGAVGEHRPRRDRTGGKATTGTTGQRCCDAGDEKGAPPPRICAHDGLAFARRLHHHSPNEDSSAAMNTTECPA